MRGRPSSLLKERSLAAVTKVVARAARTRSLVVVLPTEPVIPMAPPTWCGVDPEPHDASAVSWTTTAVHPPATAPSGRPGTSSECVGNEGVAVAVGHDGDEELPGWRERVSMLAPSTWTSGPTWVPPRWAARSAVENRSISLDG